MEHTPLSGLRKLSSYREERQHIFQSDGSLSWFLRQHRDRLVAAGALVLLSGAWHANASAFDAVVLEVGQEAAKRRRVLS